MSDRARQTSREATGATAVGGPSVDHAIEPKPEWTPVTASEAERVVRALVDGAGVEGEPGINEGGRDDRPAAQTRQAAPNRRRTRLAAMFLVAVAVLAGIANLVRNHAQSAGSAASLPDQAGPDGDPSAPTDAGTHETRDHEMNRIAAVAAVAGMLAAGESFAQGAVQWRVEDGGNGHWYEVAILGPTMTGTSARAHATSRGAHLVTITTATESEFVRSITSNPNCWGNSYLGPMIGMYRDESECTAGCWDTGEPVTYTNWHPGNPDPSLERCVFLYIYGTAVWQDYSCELPGWGSNAVAAVLEWSADCNSDGIVDYGQILDGTFADQNSNGVPDCCDAGDPCIADPCGAGRLVVSDGFDGSSLDAGTWETYLPWGCSRVQQASGVVEFQARGHLRLLQEVPLDEAGYEIVVRFQYLTGAEYFDTTVLSDGTPEGIWGSVSNGINLTFTTFDGPYPFVIGHAPYATNISLGTPVFSGSAPVNPGDRFEARMTVRPELIEATLVNLNRPGSKFTVSRPWSGQPLGNRVIFFNREFCDDRTNLESVVIRRMAPLLADCDGDGISDACQIENGAADANQNGIPDLCEQPSCADADLTSNGTVDGADLGALLAFWGPVNPVFPQADINGDGAVNGADLGVLLSVWGPCGG